MLRVHAELRTVATVGVQLRPAEVPREVERRVDGQDRVALREDEAIPIGVVQLGRVEDAGVQRGDDVSDRQR